MSKKYLLFINNIFCFSHLWRYCALLKNIQGFYFQQNWAAARNDFAVFGLLIRISIGTYFIEHENLRSLFFDNFCLLKKDSGNDSIGLSAKSIFISPGFPCRVFEGSSENLFPAKLSVLKPGKNLRNWESSSPSLRLFCFIQGSITVTHPIFHRVLWIKTSCNFFHFLLIFEKKITITLLIKAISL